MKKMSTPSSSTRRMKEHKKRRVGGHVTPKKATTFEAPGGLITPRLVRPSMVCLTPSSSSSSSSRVIMLSGDRFIPNRARTNVAKTQRQMLMHSRRATTVTKPWKGGSTTESVLFKSQLARVLFNNDNNNDMDMDMDNGTLLNFGGMASSTTNVLRKQRAAVRDDPRDFGLLPKCLMDEAVRQSRIAAQQTVITITMTRAHNAPGMVQGTDLKLMDCNGDCLAVALDTTVWLQNNYTHQPRLLGYTEDSPYTCVRLSDNGNSIALGQHECLQVCTVVEQPCLEYQVVNPEAGRVTAVAWKGTGTKDLIVLAYENGEIRCFDRSHQQAVYQGHDAGVIITVLEWNNNTIASCGGGEIKLWNDATTSNHGDHFEPRHTMKHAGVRSLEFCPQQPELLVSGGDDGLRFWNIYNGKLKARIETNCVSSEPCVPNHTMRFWLLMNKRLQFGVWVQRLPKLLRWMPFGRTSLALLLD